MKCKSVKVGELIPRGGVVFNSDGSHLSLYFGNRKSIVLWDNEICFLDDCFLKNRNPNFYHKLDKGEK